MTGAFTRLWRPNAPSAVSSMRSPAHDGKGQFLPPCDIQEEFPADEFQLSVVRRKRDIDPRIRIEHQGRPAGQGDMPYLADTAFERPITIEAAI